MRSSIPSPFDPFDRNHEAKSLHAVEQGLRVFIPVLVAQPNEGRVFVLRGDHHLFCPSFNPAVTGTPVSGLDHSMQHFAGDTMAMEGS